MYRIIELREDKLPRYEGKIIQVISSKQQYIEADMYTHTPAHYKWVLTCLVEEHKPINPEY